MHGHLSQFITKEFRVLGHLADRVEDAISRPAVQLFIWVLILLMPCCVDLIFALEGSEP